MEYLTIKQAAQKWGIPALHVQQYCAEGRIIGAIRLGDSWAVSENAELPDGVHGDPLMVSIEPALAVERRTPMPLLNSRFKPGGAADCISRIDDPDQRQMAQAEYYYFSGCPEQAAALAESFLDHADIALRLSACFVYAYANLTLNHIPYTRLAMARVEGTIASFDESTPPALRALAVCISVGAKILLHLPLPEGSPSLMGAIHLLPPGLRLFALYVQAHYTYLQGQYGTSIGMVETALALEGELFPLPTIYLHLVATMDYVNLRQPEKAREHLLAAWTLAQPDDFIEPFAEHHGLIGGMLEAVIKRLWPDDFRRMINLTYSFAAGWRKIHNPATGHDVADNLTTTEFAAAMLAARDWSNKEIAAHMGISENTVKRYISTALQKLNISQRKELRAYMLQ